MNTYVHDIYIRYIHTEYNIYMYNVHAVEEMSEKILTYLIFSFADQIIPVHSGNP